jgi:hypothetical protein
MTDIIPSNEDFELMLDRIKFLRSLETAVNDQLMIYGLGKLAFYNSAADALNTLCKECYDRGDSEGVGLNDPNIDEV